MAAISLNFLFGADADRRVMAGGGHDDQFLWRRVCLITNYVYVIFMLLCSIWIWQMYNISIMNIRSLFVGFQFLELSSSFLASVIALDHQHCCQKTHLISLCGHLGLFG